MEITALTALELGKKIKAGEVTVEEAVKAQLDDSPLAVVVFYAHAVSHAQRSDAGEDGRA